MKPKTNGILAGTAALLLLGAPLLAVPTSTKRPTPNAQRLFTRCRSIRTLTARLSGEATWQGQPLSTRIDLTFARGDTASGTERPRLRLEMKGSAGELTAWVDGPRYACWRTDQRRLSHGQLPESTERRWDAFANPVASFVALLLPTPADRAELEARFLPRLLALPPEPLPGSGDSRPLDRLTGWAAFGARIDFWLDPADAAPRLVRLSQPDAPPGQQVEYRIEVTAVDSAVEPALLQMPHPEPLAQSPRTGITGTAAPEREDAGDEIRRLEGQLAKSTGAGPSRAALEMQLAAALRRAGRTGPMLEALQRAVAADPSLTSCERAWQAALEASQARTAAQIFLQALAKHGEGVLQLDEEQGPWVVELAESAGMIPELRAALEPLLPAARNPWALHSPLLGLAARSGDPETAASHWLALAAPPGAPDAARAAAIQDALRELSRASLRFPDALRPRLVAAARSAERECPPDLLPDLVRLYLTLDAPAEAARLVSSTDGESANPMLVGEVAGALYMHGDEKQSRVLFRQAFAAVAAQEPLDYAALLGLIDAPGGRDALVPVLRQLAAAESETDPLASAHWRYLAGDDAAAAYEAYLSGQAGAPGRAPASLRLAAATLGVVCARRAGCAPDDARLVRLAALAAEELPFAEAEMSSQQTFAGPLLDALRGTPSFTPVLLSLTGAEPQAAWVWLNQSGAPAAELDGPTLDRILDAVLPRLRGSGVSPVDRARACMGLARPAEAACVLARELEHAPAGIDLGLLAAVLGQPASAEPLLGALHAALLRSLDWEPGIAALARAEVLHGNVDGATRLLADAAPRLCSSRLYARLALLERSQGRRDAALNDLQHAVTASGESLASLVALAGAQEDSGPRTGALSTWRRAAARLAQLGAAFTADQALAVAEGLDAAGQPDEARQCLDASMRAFAGSEPDRSERLRRHLAAAELDRGQPRAALALLADLAGEILRPGTDPDSLAARPDADALPLLARAAEAAGDPRLARAAAVAAVAAGHATADTCDTCIRWSGDASTRSEVRALFSRASDPTLRRVCLALLDEAEGKAVADAVFRDVAHPGGAPYPHVSTAVALACEALSRRAASAGDSSAASRYHRWSQAMRLLQSAGDDETAGPTPGTLARALALFPECPCLSLECAWDAGTLDPTALPGALDRLLPSAAQAGDCPRCGARLRACGSEAWPVLFRWLASHDADARAQFVAAVAAPGPEEDLPINALRSEPYLRRAVELDPSLAPAWARLRDLYELVPRRRAEQFASAEKAAALLPADAHAQLALSHAAQLAGRTSLAASARARARDLDPAAVASDPGPDPTRASLHPDDPLPSITVYLAQRRAMPLRWLSATWPGLPTSPW